MKSRSLTRASRVALLAAVLPALAISAALADGVPVPDPPLPYIQTITIGRAPCDTCAPVVCAGEPVQVTVSGQLPPCVEFRGLREGRPVGFLPVVVAEFVVDTCRANCPQLIMPFTGGTSLPPQMAGQYGLNVRVRVRACPDTSVVADSSEVTVGYSVTDCPPPPIPPDSLVRTFVKLAIVPEHPCPGDSVTLQLIKNGCPPCVHLVSFGKDSLTNASFAGVINWIPMCMEFACFPETLSAPMGRLAAGSYHVLAPMTVHVVTPVATGPDSTISFTIPFEFQVGVNCGGPPGLCVTREMQSTVPPGQCAATVAPGILGDVPLLYSSDLAMAGLQGTIQVQAPFRVYDVRLADHLPGVHLSRQKDGPGARWVVFTDPGVTLAPGVRQPLLIATVTADPGALNGASGFMFPSITLAAGADGGELPLCIRRTADVVIPIRLCVAGEPSLCDVNHDGRLDVRDLVRMAGCLRHDLVDTTGACVDCNQDSTFDISDIFCCARAILRGPGVPPDSVRADDSLRVTIGQVYADGANRLVQIRVTGARALGATSIRFDYPAERWLATTRVVAERSQTADVDWYPLLDLDDPGHVYLGALRLGDSGGEDAFEFGIVMQATSAPLPGDKLEGVGAEFGARDGAVIKPSSALPVLSLTAPAPPEPGPGPDVGPLALSSARPNPFNTATAFVVTLPNSSQLDLSVHDLAGRRIATLAHGTYSAGHQLFTWDGAGVHDGLYFVQLTVNGQVRSTRVALLRNTH